MSSDPIESAAKGATKGVLEFSRDSLKEFIKKLKNKELAFIEDIETIEIAKEQRNKSEWKFFKRFINDKDLSVLFQLGLTLRRLEEDGKPVDPLLKKIVNKYDVKGVHIAQIIQSGIFSKYIGNILDKSPSEQRLKNELEKFFADVDKTVIFIRNTDDINKKAAEMVTKIRSYSPETFVITGMGTAKDVCKDVFKNVMNEISDYNVENYSTENRKIYFLNRIKHLKV